MCSLPLTCSFIDYPVYTIALNVTDENENFAYRMPSLSPLTSSFPFPPSLFPLSLPLLPHAHLFPSCCFTHTLMIEIIYFASLPASGSCLEQLKKYICAYLYVSFHHLFQSLILFSVIYLVNGTIAVSLPTMVKPCTGIQMEFLLFFVIHILFVLSCSYLIFFYSDGYVLRYERSVQGVHR